MNICEFVYQMLNWCLNMRSFLPSVCFIQALLLCCYQRGNKTPVFVKSTIVDIIQTITIILCRFQKRNKSKLLFEYVSIEKKHFNVNCCANIIRNTLFFMLLIPQHFCFKYILQYEVYCYFVINVEVCSNLIGFFSSYFAI